MKVTSLEWQETDETCPVCGGEMEKRFDVGVCESKNRCADCGYSFWMAEDWRLKL